MEGHLRKGDWRPGLCPPSQPSLRVLFPLSQSKMKAGHKPTGPVKTKLQQPWTPGGPELRRSLRQKLQEEKGPCSGKEPLGTPAEATIELRVYQGMETEMSREEPGRLKGRGSSGGEEDLLQCGRQGAHGAHGSHSTSKPGSGPPPTHVEQDQEPTTLTVGEMWWLGLSEAQFPHQRWQRKKRQI